MKAFLVRYQLVLIVFIFILALFLRFYRLDAVPNGLYQDETAIGYNAYSILTTGRDEYGIKMPIYFKSFGDQKLPVYIYMTSVSEKLFGVTPFAVRFPSALFGSLTIVVLFFLVKKITAHPVLGLVSALLLTITPWHLQFSRAGFEVNVALFFALLASLLLILGKDEKRWQILLFIGSILSFALSMYSYNVTRLLSPVLFITIILVDRHEFLKIKKPVVALSIATFLIAALPFLSTILTSAGASSASGALITSHDIQAKGLEFRSYFIDYGFWPGLFFNKWVMTIWTYFENLGSILNLNFFFVQGSPHGNQGIGTIGSFYLFELPLFLVGIWTVLKNKTINLKLFILWGVISFLVLGLSKEVPHATRGYFLLVPVTIFTALGLVSSLDLLKRSSKAKIAIVVGFAFFALFNIVYYFSSYYVRFPVFYAKQWRQQDQALVSYLIQNDSKYDNIIFDTKAGFIYTSYLFYSKYNPEQFYSQAKRLPDDTEGFSAVESFGKISFRDIDWTRDYKNARTLIVTNSDNKPHEIPEIARFDYPIRPVVLSVKERIAEFPVTDNAYVLVEGKE